MTTKQKIFVKEYIDNKGNGTKAALTAYDTKDYNTAHSIATENLQKPAIVSALQNHNELIEQTILDTVRDFNKSEKIQERTLATDTAKWIHDKIHGKATQKTENTGLTVVAHVSDKRQKYGL